MYKIDLENIIIFNTTLAWYDGHILIAIGFKYQKITHDFLRENRKIYKHQTCLDLAIYFQV